MDPDMFIRMMDERNQQLRKSAAPSDAESAQGFCHTLRPRDLKKPGKCLICKAKISEDKIRDHLATCAKKKMNPSKSYYLIQCVSLGYWLYVLADGDCTLKDFDDLLKDVWVECCGHLSKFEIDGQSYERSSGFCDEDSKSFASGVFSKILHLGTTGEYEYDFGSTTEVDFKVVQILPATESSSKKGEKTKEDGNMMVVGRNEIRNAKCKECKSQNATQECEDCNTRICETCADEHECGEEMLLPIMNSPRSGVCGYGR